MFSPVHCMTSHGEENMSSALTIIIIPILIMIIMTHLSTMKEVMQPRAQMSAPGP